VLKFKKLHPEAILPKRWSELSVGWDIHAHLLTDTGRPNTCLVPPGATRNVTTGLAVEPPPGHFLLVCSRSGLAEKGLFVCNSPGIIDPDYRGELKVLIHNGSNHESYYVKHEQRIAQLVLMRVNDLDIREVTLLSPTARGELGFGSTGS